MLRTRRDGVPVVQKPVSETRLIEIAALGERLSALRLCDQGALTSMRRSLERHGQLNAVTLFVEQGQLEILDGFKRVRAARALGLRTLVARVDDVGVADAKLRLTELHTHHGLTEIEEAWVVRSLYREDRLSQPEIARRMSRHKSWVCRRLMLVEALDVTVQADVRLGLLAPRAAISLSRLPRGNQPSASSIVVRRGLTVRQTELLVDEALEQGDPDTQSKWLAKRAEAPSTNAKPGPLPTRAVRNEADWMCVDIRQLRESAGRLESRLLATPLQTFTPAAEEVLRDSLARLVPVLRAVDALLATVLVQEDAA